MNLGSRCQVPWLKLMHLSKQTKSLSSLHYRIISKAIAAVGDKKYTVLLESRGRASEQDQHNMVAQREQTPESYFCALWVTINSQLVVLLKYTVILGFR